MNNGIPPLLAVAAVTAALLTGCGRETTTSSSPAPNVAGATGLATQTTSTGDIDPSLWPAVVTCDGYAKADSPTQQEIRFRLINYYTTGLQTPVTMPQLANAIAESCATSNGSERIGEIVDWQHMR